MSGIRMTFATASVLQALAAGYRYGFDIVEVIGVRGGTVYPLLRRLEARGVVSAEWEDAEIGRHEGRPSRRYYRLSPEGEALALEATRRFPIDLTTSASAQLQQIQGKG